MWLILATLIVTHDLLPTCRSLFSCHPNTTVILAEFCDKRKKRRVAKRPISFFFFVLVLESKTSRLKSVFKQQLSQNKTTARIIGRQDFIFVKALLIAARFDILSETIS